MPMIVPIRKAGESITVPFSAFNGLTAEDAATLEALYAKSTGFAYCLDYGLKQTANDGHAASTTKAGAKPETAMEKARKKLDRAIAGLVKRGSGRASIADPVLRRATIVATAQWLKFAKENVAAASAARGKIRAEDDWADESDDEIDDEIVHRLATAPDSMAAAAAWVEANKKPTLEIGALDAIMRVEAPAPKTGKKK